MRDLSTLPKVESHLHLEGILEPETVLELARRNKVGLPYADLDDLRCRYESTDLQSFLDLLYANLAVLQTEQDFSDLVTAYVARGAAISSSRSASRPSARCRPVPATPCSTRSSAAAGRSSASATRQAAVHRPPPSLDQIVRSSDAVKVASTDGQLAIITGSSSVTRSSKCWTWPS